MVASVTNILCDFEKFLYFSEFQFMTRKLGVPISDYPTDQFFKTR